ncbi:MAG: hypothetical protein DWP92_11535 [Armatimonadetes bacterium]|nr:MAG: hypothetical protein DWP92_11535 [Armatimonadota bacterium]
MSLDIAEGPGGAPAALLISQTQSITTLPNGCQMAVGLPPMVFPLGLLSGTGPGEGSASLSGTVTGPPGATYYVAALMQDGGNTITSNTLEIQVAP